MCSLDPTWAQTSTCRISTALVTQSHSCHSDHTHPIVPQPHNDHVPHHGHHSEGLSGQQLGVVARDRLLGGWVG
jgi:hypothetical protein